MITQELLKTLFNYNPDTGLFTRLTRPSPNVSAGDIAGYKQYGYVIVMIANKSYKAHRLAWLYIHGEWPEEHIDHLNGVRCDNRLANLRQATNTQNSCNRKISATNKSGLKGVFWRRDRSVWRAAITVNGKQKVLGTFKCKHEAHSAYCHAADKYHKEFAHY